MTQNDLNKLQIAQLELMDEIHRICVQNGVDYYMIGGTALGSVRHGGFIPWDIDIDIAMKREDYDKFKALCSEHLNPRFSYCDYLSVPDYDHPHALVCIKNTSMVLRLDKYNPERNDLGIYIDVFPLDNAPVEPALQQKQKKEIAKIKKIKRYKIAKCNDGSKLKRFVKKSISALMFWTSIDKLNRKMDECMRRYNTQDTGLICSMASRYSYEKQCMPADIYGKPTLAKFEDRQYFAPEKNKEYLVRIYKDYMKLPPESERQFNLKIFESIKFDK